MKCILYGLVSNFNCFRSFCRSFLLNPTAALQMRCQYYTHCKHLRWGVSGFEVSGLYGFWLMAYCLSKEYSKVKILKESRVKNPKSQLLSIWIVQY